ncbi:hypothetical protein CEXT_621261 [Caerostris extrusa]|uniref:RGS domain-containing protein n=1 Tax=Caerostris extrusa TaxID=172846 RepID=A0AAV4WMH0_CAEEX|nr:hypothetical protein CEXT_621261 [Caerostris extrusa]
MIAGKLSFEDIPILVCSSLMKMSPFLLLLPSGVELFRNECSDRNRPREEMEFLQSSHEVEQKKNEKEKRQQIENEKLSALITEN